MSYTENFFLYSKRCELFSNALYVLLLSGIQDMGPNLYLLSCYEVENFDDYEQQKWSEDGLRWQTETSHLTTAAVQVGYSRRSRNLILICFAALQKIYITHTARELKKPREHILRSGIMSYAENFICIQRDVSSFQMLCMCC